MAWRRLSVELPELSHSIASNHVCLVQVAWLFLLSIYESNPEPSCSFARQGDCVSSLHLLSLSVDKALALEDHTRLIRSKSANAGERDERPRTMIWQGSLPDTHDFLAQQYKNDNHGKSGLVLVLDFTLGETVIAGSPVGTLAVHVLFDQARPESQEDEVIGRIETLKTILHALNSDPRARFGDATFLSDYDRRRILAWNQPDPGAPLDVTIPSNFALKVAEHPDAPAIYAWDGEMTYKELDLASSEIASSLVLARQSGPDDLVLFNMRKSKWALAAALAILKSGKALVPVDPSWPRARLDQIAGITRASLAVCDEETRGLFGSEAIEKVTVPPVPGTVQPPTQAPPNRRCTPSDLAFVLFSSGSTGVPKGMLRQHNTACTGCFAHAKAMHLDSTSRVLQFANHVFDVAMLDFFTTLLMGACACIPSEHDRKNDLAGFVQRSRADWALLTPTVAALLDPSTVPSLKFVTLGGESINSATLRKWLPFCRVGINYGSAEVDVTHARDVVDDVDLSNVGRRLPSCTAHIVDPDDAAKILPVGAIGELVIGGPTMARGYLKDPARTAQVFLARPQDWMRQGVVGRDNGSRIYRMGDLCRQRVDGSLDFVGRKDFQVKVNGQKVELGDVETVLEQHPAVRQCVILYPSRGSFAKRLVAIVQSVDTQSLLSRQNRAATATIPTLSFRDLTSFLSGKLPSFMLPTVLIGVNGMPYTPTMKIDRNQLKNWLLEDDLGQVSAMRVSHISTSLNGPSLSTDEHDAIKLSCLIADLVAARSSPIWASINGHDNRLLDIGINSAQVMRLAASIRNHFGVKILVEILGSRDMTIRELAAQLTNNEGTTDEQTKQRLNVAKSASLQRRTDAIAQSILGTFPDQSSIKAHVFLTGATGYLGVQVLVNLLESAHVASITVLVRSAGVEQALDRVKAALEGASASQRQPLQKIRAWPGISPALTLALPRSIGGSFPSYDDLEAANVISTEQLLKTTLASPYARRFVFISGGRYPDPARDESADIAARYTRAAQGSGYAQSKLVAEQVVDHVRRETPGRSIAIVSPAYLIGSRELGLANQDDYLWRIVWAAVRVGAFNMDETEHWLFVADVHAVAERVVGLTLQGAAPPSNATITPLDGMSIRDFWGVVSGVLGVSLVPEPGDEWLRKVRQDMNELSSHLLWPLAETLDGSCGRLTDGDYLASSANASCSTTSTILALQQNVQHLESIDFFKRE